MKSFKYIGALVALFAASCAFAADEAKTIDTGIPGTVLTQGAKDGKSRTSALELTVQGSATSIEDEVKKGLKAMLFGASENQAKALNAAGAAILSTIPNKSAIAGKGSVIKLDAAFDEGNENELPVVNTNLKLGLAANQFEANTRSVIGSTTRTTGNVRVADGSSEPVERAVVLDTTPAGDIIGNVEGADSIAVPSVKTDDSTVGQPLVLATDPAKGNPSVSTDKGESTPVPDPTIVTSTSR